MEIYSREQRVRRGGMVTVTGVRGWVSTASSTETYDKPTAPSYGEAEDRISII
jgi:ribosomal 30S subunit maturation factor RimM